MAKNDKHLQLSFYNEEGATTNLSLRQMKEDLTTETVAQAMDKIVAANIFERSGVDMYKEPKNAQYVETIVTPLYDHSKNK